MDSDIEFECLKHNVGEIFDVNGDGSVVKEVLVAGTGNENPVDGAEVRVNYVGRLFDNKKEFDANNGFTFTCGSGVIDGWSEVARTMVVGEKSRVVIKSEKGYGATGAGGDIPPHATLEFDIELLSFKSEKDLHDDGTVLYKFIKSDPENWMKPENLAKTEIALVVKDAATKEVLFAQGPIKGSSNEQPLALEIDNDADINMQLPVVVEDLLKAMTLGSAVAAKVDPSQGFDKASPHFGKALAIELHLLAFTNNKKFWEFDTTADKVKEGDRLKGLGNASLAKGTVDGLARAARRYQEAIIGLEYIASDSKNSLEDKKAAVVVVNACRLNNSMVHLKLNKPEDALKFAKEAVAADSSNPKAWYRQAMAEVALKLYVEAERSLTRARDLEPKNAVVLAELKSVKALVAKENEREKKKFKGMFSKLQGFASEDRKTTPASPIDAFNNEEDYDDLPDLVEEEAAAEEEEAPVVEQA